MKSEIGAFPSVWVVRLRGVRALMRLSGWDKALLGTRDELRALALSRGAGVVLPLSRGQCIVSDIEEGMRSTL